MIWRLNDIRMAVPYGYWLVYDGVVVAALLVPLWPLRLIALGFLAVAVFFDVVELIVKWRMTHGEFRVRPSRRANKITRGPDPGVPLPDPWDEPDGS